MSWYHDNVKIGDHHIGQESPAYVIAEIGINHNGSLATAKRLIDVARDARCQAVKFQKRSPELSTPEGMKNLPKETPWGQMSYLEYKKKIEFGLSEFKQLMEYASENGMDFFASSWDVPSFVLMEELGVPTHKIASACLTDDELLRAHSETDKPIILSTGMSTMLEIEHAVEILGRENLVILHSTSSYPLDHNEVNLNMIATLKNHFGVPVGYSGHEIGLQISLAAVALGAKVVERHITLNRSMWGSDHSASLEPAGLTKLVRDIRIVEAALGDGVKKVYESELLSMERLRKKSYQRTDETG